MWAVVSTAWAAFELPAPVVLNTVYERDQRAVNERMTAMVLAMNTLASALGRYQRSAIAAEIRVIDREIATNQGNPAILQILNRQRDQLTALRDQSDAELRAIQLPTGY